MLLEDVVVVDSKTAQFLEARVSPAAGLQALELDIANPGSRQPENLVPDRLEHPADLAFLALVDDQDDLGIVSIRDGLENLRRRCLVILNLYPGGKLLERVFCGLAVDESDILFFDLVAGVSHSVVQFTDVGHQQESLGFPVEAADRQDPDLEQGGGQVVHHGETFVSIVGAGDDPGRLVEKNGFRLGNTEHLVVDRDHIALLDRGS